MKKYLDCKKNWNTPVAIISHTGCPKIRIGTPWWIPAFRGNDNFEGVIPLESGDPYRSVMRIFVKRILVLVIIFGLIVNSGCKAFNREEVKKYKETRLVFGTYITVQCLYTGDQDLHRIVNKGWTRIDEIYTSMNALSTAGDISRINENGFSGVKVSDGVYELIGNSIKLSELTGGAFDITVFPLVELWKKAEMQNKLPPQDTLISAMNKVGYEHIRLEPDNTVKFDKKGMKIDLGAIAKGYAVDQFAKFLLDNGINDFLIDAGGDIHCKGKNIRNEPWKIGVRHPLRKGELMDVIYLEQGAVTTSGDYERVFMIDNRKYSHIIDPLTGHPTGAIISATVIAPSAEQADALSTAVLVLGKKKGLELIESQDNVEVMVIINDKGKLQTFNSSGFNR